jgi:glycosyl transferase, family 25
MNIPVFVINLTRSVERRSHTVKQLNDLDVQFQLVEAINGAELSDQEILSYNSTGAWKCGFRSRYLLKEEIGCALSHLKVYRKMVEEGIDTACILEDDNDYKKDFKNLLFNELSNIGEWDLLYLGHHPGWKAIGARSRKKKKLVSSHYSVGEAVEVPLGSYAYIIKQVAAKKILENAYPIRMPFDVYIGNTAVLGVRTFLLSPPCVFNSTLFDSTIYNNKIIIYQIPFIEALRIHIRKIYKWFPFLLPFRAWIHSNKYFLFVFMRKIGILENSYARLN